METAPFFLALSRSYVSVCDLPSTLACRYHILSEFGRGTSLCCPPDKKKKVSPPFPTRRKNSIPTILPRQGTKGRIGLASIAKIRKEDSARRWSPHKPQILRVIKDDCLPRSKNSGNFERGMQSHMSWSDGSSFLRRTAISLEQETDVSSKNSSACSLCSSVNSSCF